MSAMLEVADLHAYYGKSHILQGVTFAVGEAEIVSMLGRNGVGRSTTLKAIMGAKKKPLETWSLSDLGLDADQVGLSVAYTQVEDTTARPPRTAGEIVTDEDGSGAGALVEFLASKKFI